MWKAFWASESIIGRHKKKNSPKCILFLKAWDWGSSARGWNHLPPGLNFCSFRGGIAGELAERLMHPPKADARSNFIVTRFWNKALKAALSFYCSCYIKFILRNMFDWRAGRTANALVLKTGARKGFGVRIPSSPLIREETTFMLRHAFVYDCVISLYYHHPDKCKKSSHHK